MEMSGVAHTLKTGLEDFQGEAFRRPLSHAQGIHWAPLACSTPTLGSSPSGGLQAHAVPLPISPLDLPNLQHPSSVSLQS